MLTCVLVECRELLMLAWTSRDLILKERNSYVLLESITSLISDLETICLDSGIVIADMQ